MPSVSSQPFFDLSLPGRGDERFTVSLFYMNGLRKCEHSLLNGKPSLKARLIMICLIHISPNLCSAVMRFFGDFFLFLSLLTAVLLAAPSPGDVRESLHVRTHYKQKNCAGHHRGSRYGYLKDAHFLHRILISSDMTPAVSIPA